MDWKPIVNKYTKIPQFTCLPVDQPKYITPYGQSINGDLEREYSQFYCLNRGDTNPFLITNGESNVTWTQYIKKECDGPNLTKTKNRRCLGLRPDICVDAQSKLESLCLCQFPWRI